MNTRSYWQQFQRQRIARRRLLGGAAVGAAGLVVAASCGGEAGPEPGETPGTPGGEGKPQYGGRYQEGTDVNIDTLDPHISIAGGPTWFPRVYNVLLKQSSSKPDFFFMDLAEEYESPEATQWIFTIRPGVKIAPNQAGIPDRELGAEDAIATFDRIKGLPQANACVFVCKWVDKTEASADGKQLTVTTPKPYAYFLLNIGGTLFTSTIAPREVLEKGEDFMKDNAIGGGPFFVRPGSYIEGQALTLDKNPNYYRTDDANGNKLPYSDGYDISIIPDRATRRTRFISRQSYSYGAENRDEGEQLLAQYDVYLGNEDPANTFIAFTMNVTRPPWDNPLVRKAALYAINRQQYIDIVYKGNARANGLVHWPQGDYALPEEELEQLQPFNPDRSKELIQQAGFDLPLTIKVIFPGNSTIEQHNQHLPIWLEQMRAAGFDVQQDAQDFGTWLDNYTNKNYDASLSLNQVYETPEIPLDFQHSEGPARSNIYSTGLMDPEIDAAIDATKEITDSDELVQAIRDVQRKMYDKGPMFIPIVSPFSTTLYWNFVKNIPRGLGNAGLLVSNWWLDGAPS